MVKESMTDIIETLIDESSLLDVLIALELICDEKAKHIMENWQDKKLAALWRKAGSHCGSLARHKDIAVL